MYCGIISDIDEGSASYRAGIRRGDGVVSLNGNAPNDVIDFLWNWSDYGENRIEILRKDRILRFCIKVEGEAARLEFEKPIFDEIGECVNSCDFCFVDQLPTGLREELYFKDDDFRLSFLSGNYISANNLKKSDIGRVISQKLSPLFISLHTVNVDLRNKIMGTNRSKAAFNDIKELLKYNIDIYFQIVVIPDVNDKRELEQTLNSLKSFFKGFKACAVVPVGVTDHSSSRIRAHDKDSSEEVIGIVNSNDSGNGCRERIFAADEFYINANEAFPKLEHYGDINMYEDGVGESSLFIEEFISEMRDMSSLYSEEENRTERVFITSEYGSSVFGSIKPLLKSKLRDRLKWVTIKNKFLGGNISVSGLLAGSDILETLRNSNRDVESKEFLIPSKALFSGCFIDGVGVEEMRKLGFGINACEDSGVAAARALKSERLKMKDLDS